jgi:hypothetical protein
MESGCLKNGNAIKRVDYLGEGNGFKESKYLYILRQVFAVWCAWKFTCFAEGYNYYEQLAQHQ